MVFNIGMLNTYVPEGLASHIGNDPGLLVQTDNEELHMVDNEVQVVLAFPLYFFCIILVAPAEAMEQPKRLERSISTNHGIASNQQILNLLNAFITTISKTTTGLLVFTQLVEKFSLCYFSSDVEKLVGRWQKILSNATTMQSHTGTKGALGTIAINTGTTYS